MGESILSESVLLSPSIIFDVPERSDLISIDPTFPTFLQKNFYVGNTTNAYQAAFVEKEMVNI